MRARGWRAAALALVLVCMLPTLVGGETLGEVFRRVNPSVVVIRARGEEVTEKGMAQFRRSAPAC